MYCFLFKCGQNSEEGVFYNKFDEEMELQELIVTEQQVEIQLYKSKKDVERYMATFNYGDTYYYCTGEMPYLEMEKILKYLFVLDD